MPAPDPGLRENYFIAGRSEQEGQGGIREHNAPAELTLKQSFQVFFIWKNSETEIYLLNNMLSLPGKNAQESLWLCKYKANLVGSIGTRVPNSSL